MTGEGILLFKRRPWSLDVTVKHGRGFILFTCVETGAQVKLQSYQKKLTNNRWVYLTHLEIAEIDARIAAMKMLTPNL